MAEHGHRYFGPGIFYMHNPLAHGFYIIADGTYNLLECLIRATLAGFPISGFFLSLSSSFFLFQQILMPPGGLEPTAF